MITADALDWVLLGGLVWLWITAGLFALMILAGIGLWLYEEINNHQNDPAGIRRWWGS